MAFVAVTAIGKQAREQRRIGSRCVSGASIDDKHVEAIRHRQHASPHNDDRDDRDDRLLRLRRAGFSNK